MVVEVRGRPTVPAFRVFLFLIKLLVLFIYVFYIFKREREKANAEKYARVHVFARARLTAIIYLGKIIDKNPFNFLCHYFLPSKHSHNDHNNSFSSVCYRL